MFTFPALKGLSVPLEIDTWNSFNKRGQITQYDATFRWWDWAIDSLLDTFSKANNFTLQQTVGAATNLLAQSICGTSTKYCNGTNQQYASNDECVKYLTQDVRFGKSYELGVFLSARLA